MCGILGFISTEKCTYREFEKALSRMHHRGPDSHGVIINKNQNIAIGHNRLSIIDLSNSGHQPMVSLDGRYKITYNGEVYNHVKIRKTLEKKGYQFNSKTDTEVVLNSFIEWGAECLKLFNGMFSFCIWDEKKDEFFIARDRIGIKPLFYYHDEKTFIFSSEIKSILEFPFVNKDRDLTAIYDFFTYLYIPTPKTIYKNIKKLNHAHYLIYSSKSNKIKKYKYWMIDPHHHIKINENDTIDQLKEIINESVKLRLMSDVPVGVLLSGGLDSSVITGIATQHYESKLQSFTIGFDERSNDESKYAKIVSDTFLTEHTNEVLNFDSFDNLFSSLHKKFDEPFADSSLIPTYLVSLLASKKIKVALSGDGGDEVFYGYNWYNTYSKGQYYDGLRRAIPTSINKYILNINSIERYKRLKFIFIKDHLSRLVYIRGGMINEEKHKSLNPDFLKSIGDYDDYWFYKNYWDKELDYKTQLQFLDFNTYLPDDILRKVDMMSMLNSLETRVPLLDHNLVEFVYSLPVDLRNHFGLKYIFKKTFKPMLPISIINKKKKGFSIPLRHWFNSKKNSLQKNTEINEYFISAEKLDNPVRIFQAKVLEQWL